MRSCTHKAVQPTRGEWAQPFVNMHLNFEGFPQKLYGVGCLAALAALAVVGAASAQSSVTISGGMVLATGFTKFGTDNSGLQITRQTGNFALSGTEDLGGGLRASFRVETTVGTAAATDLNTADASRRTLLGDRGAAVTLSGGFGSVLVGRAPTSVRALFGSIGDVSRLPVLTGLSDGSAGNRGGAIVAGSGDAAARIIYGDAYANQVAYTSPAMNGFTVGVGVVPVQTTTANTSAIQNSTTTLNGSAVANGIGDNAANKDTYSASVMYAAGPIAAALNYVDAQGGSAPYKQTTLFASYDLGVAKIGLTHQRIDLATGVDPGNATALTAGIPMGAGTFSLGYGTRSATASASTTFADDAKQTFVGYRHDLSKRTAVSLVHNRLNRTGSANDIKETHLVIGHSF